MSRSFKKHPVTGITCAESEKKDKEFANRKLRRKTKHMIQEAVYNDEKILPEQKDTSDTWEFNKDGKRNWKGTEYEKRARRK